MKKRLAPIMSIVIVAVIVVSTFVAIEIYGPLSAPVARKKPFYVGVTYCGNSSTEAEQLIDRVKNYTNLFVVQSGPLMDNGPALNQICDYAVNSGLNIIVYFANNIPTINVPSFLESAKGRWGSHFLGVYYDDEPGGKMLDGDVTLYINNETASKQNDGVLTVTSTVNNSSSIITFTPLGQITLNRSEAINIPSNATVAGTNATLTSPNPLQSSFTTYLPNGTISSSMQKTWVYGNGTTVTEYVSALTYEPNGAVLTGNGIVVINNESNGTVVNKYDENVMINEPNGTYQYKTEKVSTNPGNISQFEPYQEVWDSRPMQTYSEAANVFVGTEQHTLSLIGNQSNVEFFTSDYGLYWFDYRGGYNVVLGELFGGQTDAQTLALVRGAADMQNKSWGAMIEWANQSPITLQSGTQMYNDLQQAYENGAEYAVVFNYSPKDNGTGLLQDEQFGAIQKFLTDVVQNPTFTNNVRGQNAVVLPSDYGWGMRNPSDTIWGLWCSDNSSKQVWSALQVSLAEYGSRLDIIYQDQAYPVYPVAEQYQQIQYWNRTI